MDDVEPTRELAHETWSEYFDAVSKELLNAQISIEIGDAPDPTRIETEPLTLHELTYDGRGDVFEVAATPCGSQARSVRRHLVEHPERVLVDSRTVLAPLTITVDVKDGLRAVITIEDEPVLFD